jgi:FAD/FMN-containing dehydrogenase
VLAPPNSAYGRARLIYQQRFDDVFPLAVVRPLSASDVSAVVGWARKTNLPLAIGSGGYLARFGRV